MQQLMASLVFGMSVDDAAYRAGMASARSEARRTEQDLGRAGSGMADAIHGAAVKIDRAMLSMVDGFHRAVSGIKQAGLVMTVGLTVPLSMAGKSAKDAASDFESAMGKVQAAMLTADPKDIEKLRDAALETGPAMGRSAIEAAGAVEALAKNGMSAAAILGGGLKSALTLATVGETDLSSAANLTTDILSQFNKTTSDLPKIVDLVSGALDASKMNFDDFRLAAGNAGGIVGALGYTFEDFNTGLAATAPLFSSGAEAGSSYRAFLVSLVGKSEDARKVMHKLGMEFYNTDLSAKSLAEIADQLKTKMGDLNDEKKSSALNTMFGTDGEATALKLIQLGAKGIEEAQRSIDKVRADQKVAILLSGEANATQRLATSWERLKIAIGESGLIQIMTGIKNATAGAIDAVAKLPPVFHYGFVAMGALTAAVGPMVLGMGALIGIAAPLILTLGRFGLVTRAVVIALGLVINPLGLVAGALLRLVGAQVAAAAMARFGVALSRVLGPIGLVITAATILWPLLSRTRTAQFDVAEATDKANAATQAAADANSQLANATGQAREEILKKARADRQAALDALKKASADLVAAKAALARARAEQKNPLNFATNVGAAGAPITASVGRSAAVEQAEANLLGRISIVEAAVKAGDAWNATVVGAEGGRPTRDLDLADPDRKKRSKKAEQQSRYDDELGRLTVERLRVEAEYSGGLRDRMKSELAAIDEEGAAYKRQVAEDESLTAAQRAVLLTRKEAVLSRQRVIAERQLGFDLAQEEYDIFAARNDAEQEITRAAIDLADSMAGQSAGQLRLLALQKKREAAELDLILATEATSSAKYQNAAEAKRTLDERYASREVGVRRQTEGPADAYLRSLAMSGDAMREAVDAGGVEALRGLNSELVEAGFNVGKLSDAFTHMGQRMIATLAQIAIQQKLIRPMAERLFGSDGGSGGGGLFASLAKLAGLTGGTKTFDVSAGSMELARSLDFGGYRASGGPIEPNKWYMVGERGPEPFFSGRPGTMLPNSALNADGGRRGTVIQQSISFSGGVDLATRAEVYRVAEAARTAAIAGVAEARRRRG